jgi:hypothetical protein
VTVEPLTPVDIERRQRALFNDLTRAQAALAQARDLEVDAKHELDRARRRAMLSGKAPRVARDSATVAERDAWISEQVSDLEFAAAKATVVRESAHDHLRTLFVQCELIRSLAASVRAAFEISDVSG